MSKISLMPDELLPAREASRSLGKALDRLNNGTVEKYVIVNRHFVYKQALLGEAERLVRAGVLREQEDIFFLNFQEVAAD